MSRRRARVRALITQARATLLVECQKIRVISRKPNGGGVVEMPISVVTKGVVTRNTAGRDIGRLDFDLAMFEQMAANLDRTGGPVPVYFGHIPKKARRTTPAAGFIVAARVDGDFLIGRLDLGPKAFDAVVEQEGFRGFSVEGAEDLEDIQGRVIKGWSLTGGAITNSPALDVNARLAAARRWGGRRRVRCVLAVARPGRLKMNRKERIRVLRAELAELATDDPKRQGIEAQIADLEDMERLEASTQEVLEANRETQRLLGEVLANLNDDDNDDDDSDDDGDDSSDSVAVTKLRADVKKEREAREKLERRLLARDVRTMCLEAIREGKPRGFFDGYDSESVKWLRERFGGSLDGLKAAIASLPVVAKSKTVGSGSDYGSGADTGEDDPELFEKFYERVEQVAAEKNITNAAAYDIVGKEMPEAYRALTSKYAASG